MTQVEETNIAQLSNSEPTILEMGTKALVHLSKSDDEKQKGFAIGVLALLRACETGLEVKATIKRKDGNETEYFLISDYVTNGNKFVQEDGTTKDIQRMNGRTLAVVFNVFGIQGERYNGTDKQAISLRNNLTRLLDIVRGFIAKDVTSRDIALSKQGYLKVPYTLMNDKPKDDASEGAIEDYETRKGGKVVLDRTTNKASIEELRKRVAPVRVAKAKDGTDEAQTFLGGLKMVRECVTQWNAKEGEAKVAPTKDLESELFELQVAIASYFQAKQKEAKQAKAS